MSNRPLAAVLALCLASSLAHAAWQVDRLVPGALFKGIHGLGFGPDGRIYVGSVMGQSIFRVDPASGHAEVFVPPLAGMADDVEFAPDGTLYWTGYLDGMLMMQPPGGGPRAIAHGLPGLNSLALDARGRLFASQVFRGDALWEFDPRGERPPRLVLDKPGGLNGFDFGPDGRLCGPLWFKGTVVCVNVDTAAIETVAEGFAVPAAANFNSRGELFAIDNASGAIFRIDTNTKTRTLVATAPGNLDNLAFDTADRLFVTCMSDNAIYEIDIASGARRTVIESPLSLPGGIGFAGGELYVADTFSVSAVDPATGAVRDISRLLAQNAFPTALAASQARLASTSFYSDSAMLWDRASGQPLASWTGLRTPAAIALVDANRLAVAEIGTGQLLVLDARKPLVRELLAEGLAQPMGLAWSAGSWFVSESGAGRISAIDARGTRRSVREGLARPEGIAFLPDGRLAVAETGTGRVLLVNTADGAITVAATQLPLGIPDPPGAPPGVFPTGIASGPDGVLYVSADREGSILRLREESSP